MNSEKLVDIKKEQASELTLVYSRVMMNELTSSLKTVRAEITTSLQNIADSVAKAEETTLSLKADLEDSSESIVAEKINEFRSVIETKVQESFTGVINQEMSKSAQLIVRLKDEVTNFPEYFGRSYRIMTYALIVLFFLTVIFFMFAGAFGYSQYDKVRKENEQWVKYYQKQQEIIKTLPEKTQKLFNS